MAKVRAPLHSIDLRGRMADGFVFTDWKGISCMRTFVMPSQPQTARKISLWNAFPKASKAWAGLTDPERAAWEGFASVIKPMNEILGRKGDWSGFNAYASINTILADARSALASLPPSLPLPGQPQGFQVTQPAPGTIKVQWEPLPAGTLMDLWQQRTKPSRKIYPAKYRHLVYTDGTTGLLEITGIPTGTRIAVKGRVVRQDGGRSQFGQGEVVV
jgi:hypothetical protein